MLIHLRARLRLRAFVHNPLIVQAFGKEAESVASLLLIVLAIHFTIMPLNGATTGSKQS